ncbi:MAG: hypothetical protein PHF46_04390 [Candidatus Gracilibacteria bacterium]|nr:hypothetical protein [Candidatus Gracilibacteria bacterium]MDD3120622.1 hypothetical protein [Candidatus Gracilibacteria bacterium]MDD4530707.1 hypothetical protein [Candidatus Gracilibacteria bacterium]
MNIERMSQSNPTQKTSRVETIERKITLEQRVLIESATKFAEYLTLNWPQIDDNKETTELTGSIMNYYISGSLASIILSCAENFVEMDETKIPTLEDIRTREIPESARKILTSFARQIGDLDYVPTDHYKINPTRLRKGGGGPSFDEIPEEGRKVLKRSENQIKVMCDPVEAYGPKRVVRVNIGGQDYYIARPDTILAYKVLHLLQSYEQKPEKFNTDFNKLFEALREIYSEEELIQVTQQVLTDYDNSMESSHISWNQDKENSLAYERKIPKFIEKVLVNPQLSPEIKMMIEKIKSKINSIK